MAVGLGTTVGVKVGLELTAALPTHVRTVNYREHSTFSHSNFTFVPTHVVSLPVPLSLWQWELDQAIA